MTVAFSENWIVEQAKELGHHFDEVEESDRLLTALEVIYGHGMMDDVGGDVEAPTGHFYRVERWIVVTDSQGFHDLRTYDDTEGARAAFAELERS